MADRSQEPAMVKQRFRVASWTRAQLGHIPVHASIAFVAAGLLVMGAILSGNAETGCLALSLVLIAAAILMGCSKLATVGSGLAPTSVAASGAKSAWMVWAVAALVLLHYGMAWAFVRSTPTGIDCYVFQRDAVNDLIHGVDPYGRTRPGSNNAYFTAKFYTPETESNGRVLVGLQYPPVTFLCALPGSLMGDVRYGYILAIGLSAIFLFAAMPDGRGLSLAVVLLLNPITFMVEALSWTEPLVWMLLCATFYAALKRPKWLALPLGLFLASKQYNLLALPLLGYWLRPFEWRAYWRLVSGPLAVAGATLLPFALWNRRGLWHDLVWFHLAQPARHDAISFAVVFPLALKMGMLIVLGFIAWALSCTTRGVTLFPAVYAMAMLLFVSTSKQAFANYYFLIAQCFLLAGAALWPERRSARVNHVGAA